MLARHQARLPGVFRAAALCWSQADRSPSGAAELPCQPQTQVISEALAVASPAERFPEGDPAAIKVALEDPETRKKMGDLGNTPRYETLEQFRATVHADRAKWAEVVKAVGVTID